MKQASVWIFIKHENSFSYTDQAGGEVEGKNSKYRLACCANVLVVKNSNHVYIRLSQYQIPFAMARQLTGCQPVDCISVGSLYPVRIPLCRRFKFGRNFLDSANCSRLLIAYTPWPNVVHNLETRRWVWDMVAGPHTQKSMTDRIGCLKTARAEIGSALAQSVTCILPTGHHCIGCICAGNYIKFQRWHRTISDSIYVRSHSEHEGRGREKERDRETGI